MAFDGPAVQAMMDAEVALAQQNSATAQLDLQVLGAILNAHSTAVDGRDGLNKLQADTEAAVRTRVDLDTPAGAREFQRFLVGKLRDIRGVLASASLDDTSQSALMMAWTALYHAAANDPGTAAVSPADTALPGGSQKLAVSPAGSGESYLDPLLMDDPGLWAGDDIVPPSTAAPLSTMPTSPSIPNFGGGPMPGVGSMPAWGGSGGFPLPGFLSDSGGDRAVPGLDKALSAFDEADPKDPESPEESAESSDVGAQERSAEEPAAPSADTTVVTLPDGDTVVAPSPQLASVIKTAVAGTAIPDAFRQQGMIIAPPGTPVAKPLTPAEISVGDIGIFTDHYALALGNSKTLLNGQIQHISAVEGPTFLGWEHPPVPISVSQQAGTGAPVPTRPAATAADQAGVLQPAQPAMPE
ncbi:MAG: DUF4226 domain-containing protein [Mycobacteriaceae bacterium]|nr:DUF4226 domain-containing protein [Mycobacteriaceae bacterium]